MQPGNNARGNPQGRASSEEHRRAQAELMWNDRLAGLTNKQIADKFNVGIRTVTNRFQEFPKEGYDRSVKGAARGGASISTDPATMTETAAMWDDKVNHRLSNEQLAEKYNVSLSTVNNRLRNYFPEKPKLALEKHRIREDDKLDMLEEEAMVLLNTDHYVVDKGQVIMDPYTHQPLVDSGPKFQAIDRMLKIIEAKRKMFGLDLPFKAEITHNTGVEIQVEEVSNAVAEAHRKNHERLSQIKNHLGITQGEDDVVDAEVVEDGSAPTESPEGGS